jgi:hypothetical protein
MTDQNKQNLLYFESSSMRGLYDNMEEWQQANQKWLLSLSIHQDGGKFCCIALTNPTEVMIVDRYGENAGVIAGALRVRTT